MNIAEIFCFPVMAPKFFQQCLLSHTAQPYQQMPILKREGKKKKKKEQNKYHMHQHTAYQNNFQLGDNVLYQWNSPRLLSVQLRTLGAALLQPCPCPAGLIARGSWGDVAGLLHTCTHTRTHVWTHWHAASSVVCRSVRTRACSWLKLLLVLPALSVAWPCCAVCDGGNYPSAPRIK